MLWEGFHEGGTPRKTHLCLASPGRLCPSNSEPWCSCPHSPSRLGTQDPGRAGPCRPPQTDTHMDGAQTTRAPRASKDTAGITSFLQALMGDLLCTTWCTRTALLGPWSSQKTHKPWEQTRRAWGQIGLACRPWFQVGQEAAGDGPSHMGPFACSAHTSSWCSRISRLCRHWTQSAPSPRVSPAPCALAPTPATRLLSLCAPSASGFHP